MRTFTRSIGLFLVVLLFCSSSLLGQETINDNFEFPFLGKVKATKLNIRSGAGDKFPTLLRLAYGDGVTVLEAKGEWYRITPPTEVPMFVSTKYLFMTGDATAEVTATALNVRPEANAKKAPYGQLKRGDLVTVISTQAGWTQIATPDWFGLWVSSAYVDYVGPVQERVSISEIPVLDDTETQARTLFEVASKHYEFECNKPIENWDFTDVTLEYQNLLAVTQDENLIELVDSRLSMISLRGKMRDQILATAQADSQQAEALLDIESKYQSLLNERLRREAASIESKRFDYTGWLEATGRFIGRPSPWRLTMGNDNLIYIDTLNSDIKLADYGYSLVGVKGQEIERKGKTVLLVESITIIKR